MSVFVTTCVYFKHFCKMLDHWNDVKGFALIWQKVGLIGLTYTECKLRNWKHDSGDYVMVIHVVVPFVKLISLGVSLKKQVNHIWINVWSWYLQNFLNRTVSSQRFSPTLNIPKYAREKAPNKCLSYNDFVKLDNALNIFATI